LFERSDHQPNIRGVWNINTKAELYEQEGMIESFRQDGYAYRMCYEKAASRLRKIFFFANYTYTAYKRINAVLKRLMPLLLLRYLIRIQEKR